MEIGLVGLIIGDAEQAPTRIAFITILLAFILLYRVIDAGQTMSPIADKIWPNLVAVITGALGYLFGSSANGRRPGQRR